MLGTSLPANASHRRADPGEELARRERLGHVVVGADLEAEYAVCLLGSGRHHHDRNIGARPELARDLEAVAAGQHQIEDDAVVLAAERFGLALDPVVGDGDDDAVALEVSRGQLGETRVVLDQKHLDGGNRGIRHPLRIPPRGSQTVTLHSSQSVDRREDRGERPFQGLDTKRLR